MTDKERVEAYFLKHKYAHDNRNGKQSKIHEMIYLDGFAEGRNEVTYMKASEYDECLNVYRTNEALKAEIEFEKINKKYFDFEDIHYDKIKKGVMQSYLDGLAEGKKEGYEQGILKDCLKVSCPNCTPSIENYCINCEYANLIIDKDNQIYNLEKENEQLKAQIEKLKCCLNCKKWRYYANYPLCAKMTHFIACESWEMKE